VFLRSARATGGWGQTLGAPGITPLGYGRHDVRMRTYLIEYMTQRRRERELNELRRKARISWEQTLTYLQSESPDRRVGARGKSA